MAPQRYGPCLPYSQRVQRPCQRGVRTLARASIRPSFRAPHLAIHRRRRDECLNRTAATPCHDTPLDLFSNGLFFIWPTPSLPGPAPAPLQDPLQPRTAAGTTANERGPRIGALDGVYLCARTRGGLLGGEGRPFLSVTRASPF